MVKQTSNISIVKDGPRFMIEDAEHSAGCLEAVTAEIGVKTLPGGARSEMTIASYLGDDDRSRSLTPEEITTVVMTMCAAYRDEIIVRVNSRDEVPDFEAAPAKGPERKRSGFGEWFQTMFWIAAGVLFVDWLLS